MHGKGIYTWEDGRKYDASTSTIASTATVFTPGKMAVSTRATGTTASNTDKVYTNNRTEWFVKASGRKASASAGKTNRLRATTHTLLLTPTERPFLCVQN